VTVLALDGIAHSARRADAFAREDLEWSRA
jgi:hypothetical protein